MYLKQYLKKNNLEKNICVCVGNEKVRIVQASQQEWLKKFESIFDILIGKPVIKTEICE